MSGNCKQIMDFLASDPGWAAGLVLDTRPLAVFAAGHLAGSAPFPLADGAQAREIPSIVLPPRHAPLLVVGDDPRRCREIARELSGRGREQVAFLVLSPETLAGLPPGIVAVGPSRRHLWAPPPWLDRWRDLLPPAAAGPVLDLGCGSGRAAVHLAESGYRVMGLDRQPEALDLGRQLARSRGVTCSFQAADLRHPDAVPPGPWAVVLAFRYLQRGLFPGFVRWLQPGGVAMVRTFRDAPGYDGHPHRQHRLARGELLHHFPAGLFEILAHEESFDADGRPAAGVVARRR